MEPKSFAVGVRIEHPQEMINFSQYGAAHVSSLGAASYKLTHQQKTVVVCTVFVCVQEAL